MAVQVEILSETERPAGWRFDVQAIDERGAMHRATVTLSWADYDLWSRGANEPAAVAEAVVAFVMQQGDDLRKSFDASIVRRLYEGADERIPRLIG